MRQPLYHAKKTGTTEKGSRYTILQDGPTSFHMSVQNGDNLIYEHFESPENLEYLDTQVTKLEEELLSTSVSVDMLPQYDPEMK